MRCLESLRRREGSGISKTREESGILKEEERTNFFFSLHSLAYIPWHHPLDGPEFEQAPGVGDGQGGLASCSPWGLRESDTTELN